LSAGIRDSSAQRVLTGFGGGGAAIAIAFERHADLHPDAGLLEAREQDVPEDYSGEKDGNPGSLLQWGSSGSGEEIAHLAELVVAVRHQLLFTHDGELIEPPPEMFAKIGGRLIRILVRSAGRFGHDAVD